MGFGVSIAGCEPLADSSKSRLTRTGSNALLFGVLMIDVGAHTVAVGIQSNLLEMGGFHRSSLA